MFTAKISVNNRKAFEGLKSHLEYLCQLNDAVISYDEDYDKMNEEKEKKIKILFKKFTPRQNKTNYCTEATCYTEDSSYVSLWRNGRLYTGSCMRNEDDKDDWRIARMLCFSRAFDWKDIEQELLDILG